MKAAQAREAFDVLRTPVLTRTLNINSRALAIPGVDLLTNPSIVSSGNGWIVAARAPNYRLSGNGYYSVVGGFGRIKSDTYLIRLAADLTPLGIAQLDDSIAKRSFQPAANSFEDPRLFWNGQDLNCVWSALQLGEHVPVEDDGQANKEVVSRPDWRGSKVTMALASVSPDEPFLPTALKSPTGSSKEKNWMPFVHNGQVHFMYYLDTLQVLRVENGAVQKVHCSSTVDKRLKSWSGSSQLVEWEDGWLCVAHHAARSLKTDRFRLEPFYTHRLVLISPEWKVKALSQPFFFERKGIEFCAGIAVSGDRVIFSYGVQDRSAKLLETSRTFIADALCQGSD